MQKFLALVLMVCLANAQIALAAPLSGSEPELFDTVQDLGVDQNALNTDACLAANELDPLALGRIRQNFINAGATLQSAEEGTLEAVELTTPDCNQIEGVVDDEGSVIVRRLSCSSYVCGRRLPG